MLGPLEMVHDGRSQDLRGVKQRATLAYLLLRPNRAVPTSELISALWETQDPPQTARKIIQNAVWNLRRTLDACSTDPDPVRLRTQEPGYVLYVGTEQVDLLRFQRLAGEGRALLVGGKAESAERALKEALSLWRGPLLADLAEAGMLWPELASIQNTRLDVAEDYYDAALSGGHHHSVLSGLETLSETEPLRERLSGQLMLALYRCGRQADALHVYQRVRGTLIEELGLEPGRELRGIQQAILAHDPALMTWDCSDPVRLGPAAPEEPAVRTPDREGPATTPATAAPAPETAEPGRSADTPSMSRYYETSVVMIRLKVHPDCQLLDAERADMIRLYMTDTVREVVECYGGNVTAAIGTTVLALFEPGEKHRDHVGRASHMLLNLREILAADEGTVFPVGALTLNAAVCSGAAVISRHETHDGNVRTMVLGQLVERCEELLATAGSNEIVVDESTRSAPNTTVLVAGSDQCRRVLTARWEYPECHEGALVDRDHELELLEGMIRWVQHRHTPKLVTLLGGAGVGKTRLLVELQHRAGLKGEDTRVLAVQVPSPRSLGARATDIVIAGLLAEFCGLNPHDTRDEAREKLRRCAGELSADDEEALTVLLPPGPLPAKGESCPDRLAALVRLLRHAARERTLLLLLDDLHRAHDDLLGAIEELVGTGDLTLVVVTGAQEELLERRPSWGGAQGHALTLTLAPLPTLTLSDYEHALEERRAELADGRV